MSDTNLGRVVVELQAKTAQYSDAMRGASRTLKDVVHDVAQANVHFRKGSIGTEDYAQAIRFAREEAGTLGGTTLRQLDRQLSILRGETQQTGFATRITAAEFEAAGKNQRSGPDSDSR